MFGYFADSLPFWYGWFAWSIILLLPTGIAGYFVYSTWKRFTAELAQLPPALVELQKPSVVEDRLTENKCREFWQAAIQSAVRSLTNANAAAPAEWLARQLATDANIASQAPRLIRQSLGAGEPQSLLCETHGQYVYLLALPGRYEHPQLLRRIPALAQGWLEHGEELRRAIAHAGDLPVHCFLLFVSQDGRDGASAYCYESSEQRILAETLLDEQERNRPEARVVAETCEWSFV